MLETGCLKLITMKKTFIFFLSGLLGLAALDSCNKDDNNNPPTSSFGVVNACPDAAALDVYVNSSLIASNFTYGSDTGYYLLTPGTYPVQLATTGSSTFLVTENVTMSPGIAYSIFAIDSVSSLKATVVQDSYTTPAADSVRVRFFNFSPNAPAMDLAITGGAVLFPARSFNDQEENSTYQQFTTLAAGTYNLEARLAGTSSVSLAVPGFQMQGGKVYTIYLKGFVSGTGTQALALGSVLHNE